MSLPKIDCSFEIPKPFKWNESFKVFYDHLDNEHKGLFDGIFNVNEKRGDASVLADLLGKVKFHFNAEEKDMEAATSAGNLTKSYLDGHKAAHKKYVEILSTLKPSVSDDAIDYATRWLVNHIKVTDFQYKDKLAK